MTMTLPLPSSSRCQSSTGPRVLAGPLVSAFLALTACSSSAAPTSASATDASASQDSPVGLDASEPPPVDAGTEAGTDAEASIGTAIVSATVPPLTASDPGYADFMTYVAPHINAIAPIFKWNEFDQGANGPCDESTCVWSTIDSELMTFIDQAGLDVNLLISPTTEGGGANTATPSYVFSSAYASSLGVDPQDQVVCPGSNGGGWKGGGGAPVQGAANSGVWNVNQCTVYTGTGCTTSAPYTDTTGFPVVYETPFLTAYTTFIKTLLTHYSPMGTGQGPTIGSHMRYIRFGMASAAEDIPECHDVWPGPKGQRLEGYPANKFDLDAYLAGTSAPPGYVKTVLAAERTANVASGVARAMVVATNMTFADTEAMLADQAGAGFGMEALSIGDVYNFQNGQPDLCLDDWCNNFQKYASDGLMLYLQTNVPNSEPTYDLQNIAVDGGTATATCASSNANACNLYPYEPFVLQNTSSSAFNGMLFKTLPTQSGSPVVFPPPASVSAGNITGGQLYTGDYLPITLPFAVKMHAKAFELFSCDLFAAFDPNPLPAHVVCSGGYPAPTTNGSSASAYAKTISAISGR